MSTQSFIQLCLDLGVLRFGDFTLKSGRRSPYFFNAGLFSSARALAALGGHYATAIETAQLKYDVLFGPAYKGIPLVTSTAIALANAYDRNPPWAFNRKEIKDHGEGGRIVGAALHGRVLLLDDVISAGTAIRESVQLVQSVGAIPAGVVIALDRQERGQGRRSAVQEVEQDLGLPVTSLLKLEDLIGHLRASGDEQQWAALQRYRDEFGI